MKKKKHNYVRFKLKTIQLNLSVNEEEETYG